MAEILQKPAAMKAGVKPASGFSRDTPFSSRPGFRPVNTRNRAINFSAICPALARLSEAHRLPYQPSLILDWIFHGAPKARP
jgi:hypothetical protein